MKKGWIIAFGALLAAAVVLWTTSGGAPAARVSVTEVYRGGFEQIVEASGEALASDMYTVMPSLSGRVERVYVSEGERVSRGDKLFSFDSTDSDNLLSQARYELDAALAAQMNARTEQALKSSEAEAVEVMASSPLMGAQQAALEEARQEMLSQAQRASYEQMLQEVLAQAQGGGVDIGLMNKAVEASAMLKALEPAKDAPVTDAVDAASDEGMASLGAAVPVSGTDASSLREAEIERARQIAESTPDGPEVLLCRERVRQAEEVVKRLTMTSEINGTVLGVMLKQGEIAAAGSGAVVLGDTNEISVNLRIPEYELKNIEVGQTVRLTSNGQSGAGKVTKRSTTLVSGEYGEVYGSVEVKPDGGFSPLVGASVDAEVILDESPDTLYALRECVVYDEEDAYVYVMEDGKAAKKLVTTGLENDFYVELCTGVIAGEVLVIAPFDLEDGSRVEIEA